MSSTVPLPVSVNGQFGIPGMLAVPVAVNVTAVPLSVPDALPEIVRPPPHWPVNVPAMDVGVWLAIWYWKLPHVFGSGKVGAALADTYVPRRDGVDELLPPLTAGGGLLTASADVGTRTLV